MQYRSMKTDRIQSSLQRIRASYYLAYGVDLSADRSLWDREACGTIISDFVPEEDQQAAIVFFDPPSR